MQELLDFILVRLYYRLFVRPRPVAKAALEWHINLPDMKATYCGSAKSHAKNPFAGMTMTFYMADDGEGDKVLCGALDPIPATAQTAIGNMNARHSKRFLRRLIEEGDRVFRSVWEQHIKK